MLRRLNFPPLAVDIRERILSGRIPPRIEIWIRHKFLYIGLCHFGKVFRRFFILTRSIVFPRHQPFESPSLPMTNTWHPCRNGNWFGSRGLKSYNAVATTSRNGHDSDWFRLKQKKSTRILENSTCFRAYLSLTQQNSLPNHSVRRTTPVR